MSGLVRAREYNALLGRRELQGERARALVGELGELERKAAELRERLERILLTYGMPAGAGAGPSDLAVAGSSGDIDSIYSEMLQRGLQTEDRLRAQLATLETFVAEVESFEQMHAEQVRSTPSISPLAAESFVLTSPFGMRQSPFTKRPDLHPGLDMAAEPGTPIMAPADGVVVFAGRYPSRQSVAWWRYGNLVAIRHGERFITLFGHCQEILVRNGDRVGQRDIIATVGNSGWSTSPHLHYEVRTLDQDRRFVPVDPRVYILDHRWRDQERFLVEARRAPDLSEYEPLPGRIAR